MSAPLNDPATTTDSHFDIAGITVPSFLYGTAWKESATERLTRLALNAGFRGIDTANQRKHYHEVGVGKALAWAFDEGLVTRDQLFLQTKFTYVRGQDHRLPYDPRADHPTQVRQSMASSLEHLHVEWLDSYVLHGPAQRHGLSTADRDVWRTMEELQRAGKTRLLGVSNVSAEQLQALCTHATVPPAFVQNRCYARFGWDREVRAVCREFGVVYQGFSLLTANRDEMRCGDFVQLRQRIGRTSAQIVFRFARQLGMIRLTGTSDREHMREDLACDDFQLSDADMQLIENIAS